MTNSTAPKKDSKKKKPKGPIRFEAIVPALLLLILITAYGRWFFDSNLESVIEWTGTYVHGAQVDVADVDTSVFGGYFQLTGLEITDKDKPQRNMIEVGLIRFDLLWDALLRAKFVVETARVENIQALTPRDRPGRVLKRKEDAGGPAESISEVEQAALDQAKKSYNDNMLGDLANIVGGVDPEKQLENIQTTLKTDTRIKELEKELKEKQKVWDERIKNLPQSKEFDDLIKRAQKLKFDGNPMQVAKSVAEADKIVKEADKKIKNFEKARKGLSKDVKLFDQSIKELEKMAQQDMKDLEKRFKIPKIDAGEFSKALFMNMLAKRLGSLNKYAALAQEYMPPKKKSDDKSEQKSNELIPAQRGQGTNVRFPVTTGYPLFWLKNAKISSEVSESEYSGNLSGEVIDVTSHPAELGKPTRINIKGDFPKQQIFGLDARLTVDHTTDVARKDIEMKVNSYPVGEQILTESPDIKFAMKKAGGQMQVTGKMIDDKMDVTIINNFKNIVYDIDSKTPLIKEILEGVVKDVPIVSVTARARGSLQDTDWTIKSNLGDALARGFENQVKKKIREARQKLRAYIDGRVKGKKDALMGQFKNSQKGITGQLDARKKELEVAKNKATGSAKGAQSNNKKKKLEKEGQKALKKLFGF